MVDIDRRFKSMLMFSVQIENGSWKMYQDVFILCSAKA